MNVLRFHSPEAMRAHLIQAAADAHHSLHPVQSAITFGTPWVRFVDIASRLVEFGYVALPDEVFDTEVQAGATKAEAQMTVHRTEAALLNGYLYGKAWSIQNIDGEWGHTHKAHVWPIEESLLHQAAEADWQINLLPMSGKINLEHAFRAHRAHVRGE